jgi:hypothetical protein
MTEKLDALKLVPYSEVGCFDEKDVVKAGIIVGCVKRDVLRVEYMGVQRVFDRCMPCWLCWR